MLQKYDALLKNYRPMGSKRKGKKKMQHWLCQCCILHWLFKTKLTWRNVKTFHKWLLKSLSVFLNNTLQVSQKTVNVFFIIIWINLKGRQSRLKCCHILHRFPNHHYMQNADSKTFQVFLKIDEFINYNKNKFVYWYIYHCYVNNSIIFNLVNNFLLTGLSPLT